MKKIFIILLCAAAVSSVTAKSKPMFMWFDATANFKRLSSADSIAYYLDKVKALGFTDVVVDVKPVTGEVLFTSRYAPVMREWDGFRRLRTFDYIATFITEGHKRRLRIHAAFNMFAGGQIINGRGVVFAMHPEWASMIYTDTGIVPIFQLIKKKDVAMLNPVDTAVQHHELNVLRELVTRYALDGVILDRARFDDLNADFSALSRSLFEKTLGRKVEHFPDDIFVWEKSADGTRRSKPGRYFTQWLEWRASIIRDVIAQARDVVKQARPSIAFGDYAGAWYPLYFQDGANWASPTYDPSKEYRWASPGYKKTGYADLLDFFTAGNYYFEVATSELAAGKEQWRSVEGSCEGLRHVIDKKTPVYGGLFVEQYRDQPGQFSQAVAMNLKKTDGLMVFDIVHIITRNWWDALAHGITEGGK
jgi:hypothetical protein